MITSRVRQLVFGGAALLLIPGLLSILTPSLSGTSRIELRSLQPFPGLPSGFWTLYHFPAKFDRFASDQFPFREDIIRWSSRALHQFGISISPEVLIGRNGWLFLRQSSDVLNESRGVTTLSVPAIADWTERFVERQRLLAEKRIRTLLVIVPNKHTVYPQFLNSCYFKIGNTITDQLIAGLRDRGVEGVVDLRPSLIEAARTEQVYDRLDTHWNDRGALVGYNAIMSHIPDAKALSSNQILWRQKLRSGDLARLLGDTELTEQAPDAEILDSRVTNRFNFAEKAHYKETPWSAETVLRKGPRVIFFCDSFTNGRLYKFLEQSFPHSVFMHHNGMGLNKTLIDAERPNLVVYLIVERLLPCVLEN
jgi:hypothetical protein